MKKVNFWDKGGKYMKYKVLLTGNNKTIINEFFTYLDTYFECISTSERYDDIMSHLKYVQPCSQ